MAAAQDVGCWVLDVGRWPMAAAQDVGCWMLDVGRWLRRDVGSVARTQVEIGLLLFFVCIAVDAASCIPLDCLR